METIPDNYASLIRDTMSRVVAAREDLEVGATSEAYEILFEVEVELAVALERLLPVRANLKVAA